MVSAIAPMPFSRTRALRAAMPWANSGGMSARQSQGTMPAIMPGWRSAAAIAVRPPSETPTMRARVPEMRDQGEQVIGQHVRRIRPGRRRGAPVSARIVAQHAVFRQQRGHLRIPDAVVRRQRIDQHDRRRIGAPLRARVQPHAVDRDLAREFVRHVRPFDRCHTGSISPRPPQTLPVPMPTSSLPHSRRMFGPVVMCCVPACMSRNNRCMVPARNATPPAYL